jgi:hypothetical protein
MTNGGDGNTGLKMSDTSKGKIRRANLGKKSSKEKIAKISNWAKGNNKIQKNLKLGSKKSQIPIIQKTKDGAKQYFFSKNLERKKSNELAEEIDKLLKKTEK